MTEEARLRLSTGKIVLEMLGLQHKLRQAGLWKTYHKMDATVKQIGWELAEKVEKYRSKQGVK